MPAPGAVAAKDAETRRREFQEKERSNKEREKLERGKFKAGPISGNLEAFWKPGRLSGLDFGSNDPSWYNTIPDLVRDVANVSFMSPAGTRAITFNDAANLSIPGIQTIEYIPTFGPYFSSGLDGGGSSALEIAAQKIYVEIRSKNSGAINYAPVDVLLVILAFDSLYQVMAKLRRIYACLSNYSAKNLYLGKYLTQALGFTQSDVEVWTNQLANFRYRYNVLVTKANSIRVPTGIPLFNRHAWLESNIFKDSNTDNSQLILFNSTGYYKYVDNAGPSKLNAVQFQRLGSSIGDIFTNVESMIDELLTNTDIGVISGDIFKAFGEGGMMQLNMLPEFIDLPVVYSAEVNNQIDNATILEVQGEDEWLGTLGVYQTNTGTLYFGYDTDDLQEDIGPKIVYARGKAAQAVTVGKVYSDDQVLLNSYDKSDPSNDDIMVYSRLTSMATGPIYKREKGAGTGLMAVVQNVDCYGSEIVTEVKYFELMSDGVTTTLKPNYVRGITSFQNMSELQTTAISVLMIRQALASIFFHHPKARVLPIASVGGDNDSAISIVDPIDTVLTSGGDIRYATVMPVANVDQVAYVNKYVLNRMHEVALLSLLGLKLKSRV